MSPLLNKINKLFNPSSFCHYLAWQLFDKSYFNTAIRIWQITNTLNWRPCSTLSGLARSHHLLGNQSQSVKLLELLITSEKITTNDWLHLVHAAKLLGENEVALQALKDAWQQFPKDEVIFETLLNELADQKQGHEIIAIIDTIKAWKENENTTVLIWQAYVNLENFDAALNWLEEKKHTLGAERYRELKFRSSVLNFKKLTKIGDIKAAYQISHDIVLTESNLNIFRKLAIALYQNNQLEASSAIIARMLLVGVHPSFISTAIIILGLAGKFEQAYELIKECKNETEFCLFEIYLSQLKNSLEQTTDRLNKLLTSAKFATLTNFEKGLDKIEFNVKNNYSDNSKNTTRLSNTPEVSIIMTCFNDAKYLQRAVKSIFNQTIQGFELIIVDDASTDNTYQSAVELSKLDNRIKVFRNEQNSGPYYSKNSMLAVASGKYLAFHDADDISHPERLARQILAVEQNTQVFASMCYHIRICENTGQLVERGFSLYSESPISLVLPREKFLKVFGAFDTVRAGADSELIRRIQAHLGNNAIHLLPFPLYFASFRQDSLTTNSTIGLSDDKNSARQLYRKAGDTFHNLIKLGKESAYVGFPSKEYRFEVPEQLRVKIIAQS